MLINKNYRLLVQEGHLTSSCLRDGLNSILHANIDDLHRGLFYSGLFNLATGFERLLKIVIVLDYKRKNDFKSPNNKNLRDFGHDIANLYESGVKISRSLDESSELKLTVKQKKILNVLSKFGKGARYYNLDELTSDNFNSDPINDWLEVLEFHIFGLNAKVRKDIESKALSSENGHNWVQNINGEWITYAEFYYLFLAINKANHHVIWSIISMVKPFYHTLYRQEMELHKMIDNCDSYKEEIPFMHEFFTFFLTSKDKVMRKRQWIK